MSVISMPSYVQAILKHGVRSVRTGGLPFFFAVFVTALGVFSLAAFLSLVWNFRGLAAKVGDSVAAVAFLDVEDAAAAREVHARIALHPGVNTAHLLHPQEVLARARRGLSGQLAALDEASGLTMPFVVEFTPKALGADRAALVQAVQALDGVDEVMQPSGELTRVDALLKLLYGAGVFLAVLMAVVVIVVVGNAVRLTVYQRKDELAILKLVGATDAFVTAPLLLSGVVQGALGAVLGLSALMLLRTSLAVVVNVALSGALGHFELESMPILWSMGLSVVTILFGFIGAALSVGRYTRV